MALQQFEKWFVKSTIRDIRKPYCRDTWKACLEWVLGQEDWIGPDEGGNWGIDKWEIEEELNGEES